MASTPEEKPGPGRTTARRPASRAGTPRPRTVAGRSGRARAHEAPDAEGETVTPPEPVRSAPEEVTREEHVFAGPLVRSRGIEPHRPARRPDLVTTVIAGVLAVLVAMGVWEVVYLNQDAPHPLSSKVTAETPVRIGDLTAMSVVDQAATDLKKIFSASYRGYDAHVDEAAALMTTKFADDYRTTAQGARAGYLRDKIEVTVDLSAQGVVTATPQQVVALVFFTQSSTANRTDLRVSQFRAKVTMLHVGKAWLVSRIETV